MKLQILSDKIPQTISELLEVIFENRKIAKSARKRFLDPIHPTKLKLKDLGFDIKQFKEAVSLIQNFLVEDKKIVVFGDYDADGICASAILWKILYKEYRKLHPQGVNHPVPFIPHRERHGYGITIPAIDEIIEVHGPHLIITVDNGIVAHEPITYAREKGIAVVLTDHHQPEFEPTHDNVKKTQQSCIPKYPPASYVLHSTQLCGASVSWMLARELDLEYAQTQLDLAGIATISDQVPLIHANRSFAFFGIQAVRKSKNLGIVALCKTAGIEQDQVSEITIGFSLAPRINAMGRLEHGLDALRMLCTQNKKQAQELAEFLNATNSSRQELTKEMIDEAKLQVHSTIKEKIIVVHSEKFHEGILGLIAGRLVEEFHKPAVAISLGGSMAKGSARSVDGVNIVELLREIKSDLAAVGGHPLAAGFSFLPDNLLKVKSALFKFGYEKISSESLVKTIMIDCKIPPSLVTSETVDALEVLAPYGMGNLEPVFEVQNVVITDIKKMGKDQEHIKLKVSSKNNLHSTVTFDCIGWRMSKLLTNIKTGDTVTIVGVLGKNQWKDKTYPQIFLREVFM